VGEELVEKHGVSLTSRAGTMSSNEMFRRSSDSALGQYSYCLSLPVTGVSGSGLSGKSVLDVITTLSGGCVAAILRGYLPPRTWLPAGTPRGPSSGRAVVASSQDSTVFPVKVKGRQRRLKSGFRRDGWTAETFPQCKPADDRMQCNRCVTRDRVAA
jgi:hypothetical protein